MMKEFDNGLSRSEIERLACYVEEMGECCQIIGKILRFGYESFNPYEESGETNRQKLERETGDLQYRITRMVEAGDLCAGSIIEQQLKKETSAPHFDKNQ